MPAAADDDVNNQHRQQIQTTPPNRDPSFSRSLQTLLSDLLHIFISNPKIFSYVFLLLALPLSLLLSSASLAAIVSIRIEALNILEEARKDAKSLFCLRVLHALITLPLSTLLLIISASSASSLLLSRCRILMISTAVAAVRSSWWRSLLTCLLAHTATVGYGEVARTALIVAAAMAGPLAVLGISNATVVVEAFLKSVLDMGMVVSVVEDRIFGVDAEC